MLETYKQFAKMKRADEVLLHRAGSNHKHPLFGKERLMASAIVRECAEKSNLEIDLGRGRFAIIDAADLPLVANKGWNVQVTHTGHVYAISREKYAVRMHRLILNAPRDSMVDHINGNSLDNRRANLRLCNGAENQRNQIRIRGETSRFKGVCLKGGSGGKFRAAIRVDGRAKWLGLFEREEDAARAYDAAARKHYGEFAKTNVDLGLLPEEQPHGK